MRSLPGRSPICSANGASVARTPHSRHADRARAIASSRAALSRTVRETTPWVTMPNIDLAGLRAVRPQAAAQS